MAQMLIYIDEELDKMIKEYESISNFEYQKRDAAKRVADKLVDKWKSLEELNGRDN